MADNIQLDIRMSLRCFFFFLSFLLLYQNVNVMAGIYAATLNHRAAYEGFLNNKK